jgi:hypothetical protein
MGTKNPDKSGKVLEKYFKRAYLGKGGSKADKARAKENFQALIDYTTKVQPLGAGYQGSQDLISQLVGTPATRTPIYGDPVQNSRFGGSRFGYLGRNQRPITGYTETPGQAGLVEQTIGNQQALFPQYQQAVQSALEGDFFDIAPYQAYAERALNTQTRPQIAQTFAGLNTGLSTDLTGQVTGAIENTYLDLAAQDAMRDFEAQHAVVNQGGYGDYLTAAGAPAATATQYASTLQDLDTQSRTLQESATPGAGNLFPSAFGGGFGDASSLEAATRKVKT